MPDIKNCVAVDWRQGQDHCYFFFKDTNTFSRFNNAEDRVPPGYPTAINAGNWGEFHPYARYLRFGFTTTSGYSDYLHLFYLDGNTPKVCTYHQQTDRVVQFERLADSQWSLLLPYFDKIVAGVWWKEPTTFLRDNIFLFLMSDGDSLRYDARQETIEKKPTNDANWPGVGPYRYEIVTAVQFDRDLADDFYYIFLTGNRYLKYNMDEDRLVGGPDPVNDNTWPGLLRN
ncbi:hypothetical protein [Pseudomonas sp. Sample_24]|uniref:hypothetical protein n=1 Tax=Pseudomonas sp. Sample_24 TaxID=2448268 RepID=UPI0010329797|nr:hypothetical protein [Pseudomonas sp. Sample_24]